MKVIKQTYLINASSKKVWEALTNSEIIDQWGGGPSKMNAKKGADFSLWGGDIFGKNIEVIPEKKLVQEWFGGKWDNPSILTFVLKNKNEKTEVLLTHVNVPEKEIKDIEEGWKDYYMIPLKNLVEEENN
ncbi:MAG TPA: SRPBCC domain-containing protein [Candidatus Sulfotelmatobacter sp.]|nr:SRPBCC domain-containing protein [Candidatus Sulfotelmatobacter sp.]